MFVLRSRFERYKKTCKKNESLLHCELNAIRKDLSILSSCISENIPWLHPSSALRKQKPKTEYYFEIAEFSGSWFFELKSSGNNVIICTSETYSGKWNCIRAIERLCKKLGSTHEPDIRIIK